MPDRDSSKFERAPSRTEMDNSTHNPAIPGIAGLFPCLRGPLLCLKCAPDGIQDPSGLNKVKGAYFRPGSFSKLKRVPIRPESSPQMLEQTSSRLENASNEASAAAAKSSISKQDVCHHRRQIKCDDQSQVTVGDSINSVRILEPPWSVSVLGPHWNSRC